MYIRTIGLFHYQTRTTEWFDIFFPECILREYYVKNITVCDRMTKQNVFNLVDSLDHIYDKMPKLLEQYE